MNNGKWIIEEDESYVGGSYFKCPECEHRFASGAYYELKTFKFCPSCGANLIPHIATGTACRTECDYCFNNTCTLHKRSSYADE